MEYRFERKAKVNYHWVKHGESLRVSLPLPKDKFKPGEEVKIVVLKAFVQKK